MANEDTQVVERPADTGVVIDPPAPPEPASRDAIRAAILNAGHEDDIVSVYGMQVAVRTPCLEDLLQYRESQNDDFAMARAIANNVYMPGTDDRVFTEGDVEALMQAKFTPDMRRLNQAVMKVLGATETLEKKVGDDTKSPAK
jgi:hypothetical protein